MILPYYLSVSGFRSESSSLIPYLIQRARKRAHLCAMLRPASKKHILTISVSRVRVFTSRPSFPSLKLERSNRRNYLSLKNVKVDVMCNLDLLDDLCHFLCWSFSPTCRVRWRKPQPANTRCLEWGFGRARWPSCPLSSDTACPAASHGSLRTAA